MGGRGAVSTMKNNLGREVPFRKTVPKGWKVDNYATTAPRGYVWINNGKSHFSKEFKHALVPESVIKE